MATETKPVVLRPETRAVVAKKAKAGCFMCRHILESITKENELRDWPPNVVGEEVQFPVAGQKFHIFCEIR